ncbi:MAG: hypothetical protein OSA51_07460 [Octadecabacter sp.]|nr:hypothetical protein [Octadecabacter sp.]
MQFKALFLIFFLGPQSAAALGDLDCTTYIIRDQDGCTSLAPPFAVMSNWGDMTTTLIKDDIATAMAHNPKIAEPLGGAAPQSMSLSFGYFTRTSPDKLLHFETATCKIDALYTYPNARSIGEAWTASCDLQITS